MTSPEDALEAVEGILAQGGDADDVLRDVLAAIRRNGCAYAAIRFVENDALVEGPTVGQQSSECVVVPVVYEGDRVGELELAGGDTGLAERVAALIAPYVLVGWDTSGEPWSP
jgi:hypothetical protein